MEINVAQYQLTMEDATADYDLQSVFTHEAGHFLGLAHSPDSSATMFAVYTPGSTAFRSLAADDVAGVCAVYPAQTIDPAKCNVLPRHGFSPACAEKQTEGSCALRGPATRDGAVGIVALGLAVFALRRRRRGA